MNNSDNTGNTTTPNTDASKKAGQQPSFVKQTEANDNAAPAKVDEPKPGSDTDRQAAGDTKQPKDDDASGKSLR